MTNSWLHALLEYIKQRPKSSWKKQKKKQNKEKTQKVCENKETDSPLGIYRMKLPETCSLLKESHEKKKKKKKIRLLFVGSGTRTFWLGLLLFIQRESRTPAFKILVKILQRLQQK